MRLRRPGLLRDVTWRLGPGDRVGAGRRQRLGQDDAAAAAGRRARARPRERRARRDGARSPTSRRTPPRSPATCGCSSRWRRCAGRATSSDGQEITAGHAVRALRLSRRARPHARARPLGRRAPAAAAHAPADGRAQRPHARRAHQRPRHRHAHRARGPARRLARHARGRQPRPLLRRARVRRRLRARRATAALRHLPGGIDQYLELRREAREPPRPPAAERAAPRRRRAGAVRRRAQGARPARARPRSR